MLDSIRPGEGDSLKTKNKDEFLERYSNTHGELVGPNSDSLSLAIRLFLLFILVVLSSPSTKQIEIANNDQ